MKAKDIFQIGGNAVMYALTATQTKEIFEIISLVLSILISLIIFISKLIEWWKKAKADGKITKEEVEEVKDIIEEGIEDLQDIKKGENKKWLLKKELRL